jgi:DNA transposition AAA+ family ATPase
MKKTQWPQLPTIQSKEILSELMEAKEEPLAKMIIANTGLGKTETVKMFAAKNKHVFVITLGSSYNLQTLLQDIARSIDAEIFYGKNSRHSQLRAISDRFNELEEHNPVLILDEFENATMPVLKSIKQLYDAIIDTTSIVLIGTEQLLYILNKKATSQSIPQLNRRFKAGTRKISPLKKARDFALFFNKHIPSNKDVQDLLLQLADNYGELCDFLYPAITASQKKGKKFDADFFKFYHKINL